MGAEMGLFCSCSFDSPGISRNLIFKNRDLQNSPSFHITPPTPRAPSGFASQKRTLAFYSATQNCQIDVNRAETAILEKVCKSGAVFCNNSGNGVSGRVIRGFSGAGFEGVSTPHWRCDKEDLLKK
jgi:hypothetical protein